MQVEAQIDQDSEISQLLSLWNQQGSNVIRGNMIVYPLDKSFLYIEPLFMAADRSQLPQLKKVIVSDGTRVFMDDNLDLTLEKMLSNQQNYNSSDEQSYSYNLNNTGTSMVELALSIYERSQEKIRSGDWAGFGELQEELESVLRELVKRGQ